MFFGYLRFCWISATLQITGIAVRADFVDHVKDMQKQIRCKGKHISDSASKFVAAFLPITFPGSVFFCPTRGGGGHFKSTWWGVFLNISLRGELREALYQYKRGNYWYFLRHSRLPEVRGISRSREANGFAMRLPIVRTPGLAKRDSRHGGAERRLPANASVAWNVAESRKYGRSFHGRRHRRLRIR